MQPNVVLCVTKHTSTAGAAYAAQTTGTAASGSAAIGAASVRTTTARTPVVGRAVVGSGSASLVGLWEGWRGQDTEMDMRPMNQHEIERNRR